jgi:hypothetical protein
LTAAAGSNIKEWGEKISHQSPHEGPLGHASQAFASTIEGGGKYIEDTKLTGMAHDVTDLIKKHPVSAVAVCLAAGFWLGRALHA